MRKVHQTIWEGLLENIRITWAKALECGGGLQVWRSHGELWYNVGANFKLGNGIQWRFICKGYLLHVILSTHELLQSNLPVPRNWWICSPVRSYFNSSKIDESNGVLQYYTFFYLISYIVYLSRNSLIVAEMELSSGYSKLLSLLKHLPHYFDVVTLPSSWQYPNGIELTFVTTPVFQHGRTSS